MNFEIFRILLDEIFFNINQLPKVPIPEEKELKLSNTHGENHAKIAYAIRKTYH